MRHHRAATERWLPIKVQLREPLVDIAMHGHSALYVTVMSGDNPVGRVVVPCRATVCSAERLGAHVDQFAQAGANVELVERFERATTERPQVSIIVCTRNRVEQLDRCLKSLDQLVDVDTQIVVVDNGNDEGATERLTRAHGFGYVSEPVAGLDRARNRGLTVAEHDLVLFTDDDVEVEPRWAFWLAAAFDDPIVVAATGVILPSELETEGQVEFETLAGFVRTVEAFTMDGSHTPPAAAGRAGAGASMAFRRNFISALGGFPEVLDGGRPTKSGGDTYGLYLALRNGKRIRFEPRAIVHHRHRTGRSDGLDTVTGYATGVVAYLLLAARETRDAAALVAASKWTFWRFGLVVRHVITEPTSLATRYVVAQVRGAIAGPSALADAVRANLTPPIFEKRRAIRVARPSWPIGPGASIGEPADPPTRRVRMSVIIPTQGLRPGLVDLVANLRRQAQDDLEIIVATDGPFSSPTDLFDRLGATLDAHVVTGSTGGAGAARNHGATAASGDVLLFLDDDVEPASTNLLDAHRHAHERGHEVVVGPIYPAGASGPHTLAMTERNWWSDQARHVSDGDALDFTDVCSGNLSIDRDVFVAIGGFAMLPRREDYELGMRLIAAGHSISSAREAAILHPADCTIDGAMSRRRQEGQADTMLVGDHPVSGSRLGLWAWPKMSHRRRQLAHAAIDHPQIMYAVARMVSGCVPVLDGIGSRRRLARLLDTLSFTAYWVGVGDATGGFAGWRRTTARIVDVLDNTEHDHLELAAAGAWNPSSGGHHLVDVAWHGEQIGVADLRWGGLPFDRKRFASHLAADLGVRAQTARERSTRCPVQDTPASPVTAWAQAT